MKNLPQPQWNIKSLKMFILSFRKSSSLGLFSHIISANLIFVAKPQGFTTTFLKHISHSIHLGSWLNARLWNSLGVIAWLQVISCEKSVCIISRIVIIYQSIVMCDRFFHIYYQVNPIAIKLHMIRNTNQWHSRRYIVLGSRIYSKVNNHKKQYPPYKMVMNRAR